jgi:AmiR/NasT family two-component response regulator
MIAGRTAPLRILVVEDETPLAIEIVARLQELHYEVVGPVATGDRALELVEQQRPDLVLLDITPAGDRDGIEVAAQLRSLHDLPVIFLLAQSDDATLERVQTTLPLGCLVKPCSGRDLRLALELGFHRLTVDRELRRQRERLEDLVAERTAAWEEANRCLATHINPPQPAENAIQSSLELLQSVVENAPVRVFWKDLNLRYLGVQFLVRP